MGEEFEKRLFEIERHYEKLNPSGLTSQSIFTRAITYIGYQIVIPAIIGMIYLIVLFLLAL